MDWATIAGLATALGTLVLAVATFASIRSANRAARTAERALLFGMRPLLFPSRFNDEALKVMWADQHWARVAGGRGSAEVSDQAVYLSMSLRNAGSGIAVLQAWYPWPGQRLSPASHAPLERFRTLTRDLYIAPNDIGFWQGALRDPDEEVFSEMARVIRARSLFTIEVLYTDAEGGQRTVSRFGMVPAGDEDWLCTVSRHWTLDIPSAR
ncbi:MAG: hypothetical protein ABR498_08475 [Candidatus Dormibacteria bacterium]